MLTNGTTFVPTTEVHAVLSIHELLWLHWPPIAVTAAAYVVFAVYLLFARLGIIEPLDSPPKSGAANDVTIIRNARTSSTSSARGIPKSECAMPEATPGCSNQPCSSSQAV